MIYRDLQADELQCGLILINKEVIMKKWQKPEVKQSKQQMKEAMVCNQ